MSPEVLQSIFDFWLDVNNEVLLETGMVGTIDFQPFPRSIAQKALELGGVSCFPYVLNQPLLTGILGLAWLSPRPGLYSPSDHPAVDVGAVRRSDARCHAEALQRIWSLDYGAHC
jgi:hypothetical protein